MDRVAPGPDRNLTGEHGVVLPRLVLAGPSLLFMALSAGGSKSSYRGFKKS